jgi:hypothetical protein
LLDLIDYDLSGLVKVPLISKDLYYVSSIDDYSRRTWVYFLRTKSEVFSWFKEFKDLLKNQTSGKIKVSRPSNGGDFCELQSLQSFVRRMELKHVIQIHIPLSRMEL